MLDRDLAQLYAVETRVLNQAVRRNIERFPADFMFELKRNEILGISQFVTSSKVKFFKARDRLHATGGGDAMFIVHARIEITRRSVGARCAAAHEWAVRY